MRYKLSKKAKGYYTSLNAKNRRNSNSTVPSGTYFIYNRAKGMYNITTKKGTMGWWINPTESPNKSEPVKSSGTSANNGYVPNNSGSTTTMNKSTVYTKNQHYVKQLNEGTTVLYITNLVTGTTIEIDVSPTGFSESNKSNFDGQEIRGRSNVLFGYNSTGPKTASLSVTLIDDYCYYGLANTINFLKALMYPTYTGGFTTPPVAHVRYGKMLSMRCFASVEITYVGPKRNGYHIAAEVSISLTEIRDGSLPAQAIETGGDYL